MTSEWILAIDQGTTNTKALLVDATGRVHHQASVPNVVTYPQPGWAEQSATALFDGVKAVIAEVVANAGNATIAGIGISNQRESILIWDAATGEPIGPVVIWQCRRSALICDALRAAGHADAIEAKTGLALDPLFPAAKIAWLLDNIPGARARAEKGELRAGTVDAWLLWNLTGGAVHATDHSNASRTQLFNTEALTWDAGLCALFGVPQNMLAEVKSSDTHFGVTAQGVTALPAGTPILAMIGDSHAALFGHGVRIPGTVKATYGTGTSLMALTPKRVRSTHGISSTIAWSQQGNVQHALEGNISVSGQTASFAAELLGLADAAALSDLAETVPDSNGVAFVPALVGLGAPYWRADARGTITGLSLGTKPAHLARAALEAIAFQVGDVYSAMEADMGAPLGELRADGGASRNPLLMQFQSDILGRPVASAAAPEVSALGAAALAFSALGIAMPGVPAAGHFAPQMEATEALKHRQRWQSAVTQTLAISNQQTSGGNP
ncbi:glycerol kinase GlpK [Devosia sp. XJ19-1]|uniref:ATP:glycerol 3-phosphotransferase n=1 Tax=Devosia ureilytica TaxID=2952754 RepID=A0A9Q4APK6_9HYPH|nr:glycerol kinase GlpK [Devosia ureilytica]MCP8883764.1 glycerol kinase GlpK [Devosia ureilytica]MCP8887372.1 glycerol kinase GlpK [Devosia ureilytica]